MTTEKNKAKQAETPNTTDDPNFLAFIAKRLQAEAKKAGRAKKKGDLTYTEMAVKVIADPRQFDVWYKLYKRETAPLTAEQIIAQATAAAQAELGGSQEAPAPTSPPELKVVPSTSPEQELKLVARLVEKAIENFGDEDAQVWVKLKGMKMEVAPLMPAAFAEIISDVEDIWTLRRALCDKLVSLRGLSREDTKRRKLWQGEIEERQDMVYAMDWLLIRFYQGGMTRWDAENKMKERRRNWPRLSQLKEKIEETSALRELILNISSKLQPAAPKKSSRAKPTSSTPAKATTQDFQQKQKELGERRQQLASEFRAELAGKGIPEKMLRSQVKAWSQAEPDKFEGAKFSDFKTWAAKKYADVPVKTGESTTYGEIYSK